MVASHRVRRNRGLLPPAPRRSPGFSAVMSTWRCLRVACQRTGPAASHITLGLIMIISIFFFYPVVSPRLCATVYILALQSHVETPRECIGHVSFDFFLRDVKVFSSSRAAKPLALWEEPRGRIVSARQRLRPKHTRIRHRPPPPRAGRCTNEVEAAPHPPASPFSGIARYNILQLLSET